MIKKMDSEEQDHIEHLMATGRSANDSGPFYHHTFWESYKGSVKGKLGGLLIGGGIGLLVGGVAALFVWPLAASGATALAVLGGISAAGMLYGAHEFSEVGRVSGAVAAGLDDAEKRNHEFELSKFSVLNKRLDRIEEMVAGRGAALNDPNYQPLTSKPATNEENYKYNEDTETLEKTRGKLADYRTTHRKDDKLKERGYFYGNVALVGALVGIGVGLLLATGVGGPAAMAILEHVGLAEMTMVNGIATLTPAISGAPLFAASAAIFGVIGASFGISRDLFRMVFDKTDTIFKGIVDADKGKKHKTKAPEVAQEIVQPLDLQRPLIRTIVYPDMGTDTPKSTTHFRDANPSKLDKGFAFAANEALNSLDHTQAVGH